MHPPPGQRNIQPRRRPRARTVLE